MEGSKAERTSTLRFGRVIIAGLSVFVCESHGMRGKAAASEVPQDGFGVLLHDLGVAVGTATPVLGDRVASMTVINECRLRYVREAVVLCEPDGEVPFLKGHDRLVEESDRLDGRAGHHECGVGGTGSGEQAGVDVACERRRPIRPLGRVRVTNDEAFGMNNRRVVSPHGGEAEVDALREVFIVGIKKRDQVTARCTDPGVARGLGASRRRVRDNP